MRVFAPMVVRPVTTAWLMSSQPSPRTTSGPTRQKGPIRTSEPRRASAAMIAELWISLIASSIAHQHRRDLGLGDKHARNLRLASEPPHIEAVLELRHVIFDNIA